MKKIQIALTKRAVRRVLPKGNLAVTDPLFPETPTLFQALDKRGVVVAEGKTLAELTRAVRAVRRQKERKGRNA